MDDYDYSDSHSYRTLAEAVTHKLDEQINQQISNLIAAHADHHDKIAGQIVGLQKAKQLLQDTAKRHAMAEDAQPSLVFVDTPRPSPVKWGV